MMLLFSMNLNGVEVALNYFEWRFAMNLNRVEVVLKEFKWFGGCLNQCSEVVSINVNGVVVVFDQFECRGISMNVSAWRLFSMHLNRVRGALNEF